MSDIVAVRTIDTITGEIKALKGFAVNIIIEIGRRLYEAKDVLPHGKWGEWLEKEVDFSQATANNYMKIFEKYGSAQSSLFGAEPNSQALGNLSYSKALRLLALPENEREEFAEENDVENMSTRELDKLIKERDEAKQAVIDTEKGAAASIAEAQERADKLEEELKNKTDAARKLSDELEELKKKPIDVTVAKADPAEMEAAINKAKTEADKARKKEIADLEKKLKDAEKEKTSVSEAKAAAEGEKRKAIEELAAEKKKTEEAERALELLKKTQAMSDPIVTEFGVIFIEVQEKMKRLKELAQGAGEKKEKLENALAAFLNACKVSGEAGE